MLAIKDLNAWYGESHVLHGVDLEVQRGELVTILGRNGAGKTTTLRAIMGILDKRRGSHPPQRPGDGGHGAAPIPGWAWCIARKSGPCSAV